MQINKQNITLQTKYENAFGKRGIHKKACADFMLADDILALVSDMAVKLKAWIYSPEHWHTKSARLYEIAELDLEELIIQILSSIGLECETHPLKLVSIASLCAKHLHMDNKLHSIQTMAEVIAVLSLHHLCTIKKDFDGVRWVHSNYEMDAEVIAFKFNAMYLPPMVIRPRKLRHNRDSGYITQQGESLILGWYENHHGKNISLDVLNIQNSNEYCLDTDVISHLTDTKPTQNLLPEEIKKLSHENRMIYEMDQKTWENFQEESYKIQTLMLYHGNAFYLQNKVDKRGRIYVSGYHISPQGNSFKKSMLSFKKAEICTGVKQWNQAQQKMNIT